MTNLTIVLMHRRLYQFVLLLTLVAGGCSGDSPVAPAPLAPAPLRPDLPPAAKVTGTMTLTTRLTPGGGYEYTAQIELVETGGQAATITKITLGDSEFEGWGGPPLGQFLSGAFTSGSSLPANGAWRSGPLVATEEVPAWYIPVVRATITYGDGLSDGRVLMLYESTPTMPEPTAGSRFVLTGKVFGDAGVLLSGVTVEVLAGVNAGRRATTDAHGIYTFDRLETDEFDVGLSRTGYTSSTDRIVLKSNLTTSHWLDKTM